MHDPIDLEEYARGRWRVRRRPGEGSPAVEMARHVLTLLALGLLLLAVLAGCAAPGPTSVLTAAPAGAPTREAVAAEYGAPARTYALPDGEVWVYRRETLDACRQVVARFGPDGRLTAWERQRC